MNLCGYEVGLDRPLFLIGGPCVIEDEEETVRIAHAVRGMSVETGGEALTLIGPPGTKKTELFFDLLKSKGSRLHSSELAFQRPKSLSRLKASTASSA